MKSLSHACLLAVLLFPENALPADSLRETAEEINTAVFPTAKAANVPDFKAADGRPTWVLSIDDGGARARRIAARKAADPLAGFLDAVSSLNWENRLYITECAGARDATLFAAGKDGIRGLDSITLGAVSRGAIVAWGDFRLVEKMKDHWGMAPDKDRRAFMENLPRLLEIADAIESKIPGATTEVWQRWKKPGSELEDERPLVHVTMKQKGAKDSRAFVVMCPDEKNAQALHAESTKDFVAFIDGALLVYGDKSAVDQMKRRKSALW